MVPGGEGPLLVCGFCGARVEKVDKFRRCLDCQESEHRGGRQREPETITGFDVFNYERRGGRS